MHPGFQFSAFAVALLCVGAVIAADVSAGDVDCCADLDARIQELEVTTVRGGQRGYENGPEHEFVIKGTIGAGILYWDDGGDRDAYVVGIDGDFELAVESTFKSGWKVGATVAIDVVWVPRDAASQNSVTDPADDAITNDFEVTETTVAVEHKNYGTVQLGLQDTATDGVDNVDLSSSDTLADAGVDSWNARFFVRSDDGLLEVRWEDFFDGNLLGTAAPAIQYISPNLRGVEFSAAWGNGDIGDAALRYSGTHGDLRVALGVGYFVSHAADPADSEIVEDRGWGGSIAALHIPTGLNLAFNYSTLSHTASCEEPGAVTGKCRGDDRVYYVKGGLLRQFNSFGPTSIYGEYYWQTKSTNESDDDTLRALERSANTALELQGSRGTMWGIGVLQKFNDDVSDGENGADAFAKNAETPMEIYIGFRKYSLDVDLLGGTGAVSAKRLKDFSAVVSGITIRF